MGTGDREVSAVRIFAADSSYIPQDLKSTLLRERVSRVEALGAGVAADYADYKKRVGEIVGIDIALRLIEIANQDERGR